MDHPSLETLKHLEISETKEDDPFSQPTHHGYPILQ